jgi:hypothetical protein
MNRAEHRVLVVYRDVQPTAHRPMRGLHEPMDMACAIAERSSLQWLPYSSSTWVGAAIVGAKRLDQLRFG